MIQTYDPISGFRRVMAAAALAIMPLAPALADVTLICPQGEITVHVDSLEGAEAVCSSTQRAIDELESCNIPIAGAVRIDLVQTIAENCYGLFHCEDHRIELLVPGQLDAIRPDDSAFANIPIDDFFDSLLVHELAHFGTHEVPCPFEQCRATAEYVAYAMQVRSLSAQNRALFEARIAKPDAKVSFDAISVMVLAMAPDIFAQRAWMHFKQRPDSCAYIGQIMRGDIWFDREIF